MPRFTAEGAIQLVFNTVGFLQASECSRVVPAIARAPRGAGPIVALRQHNLRQPELYPLVAIQTLAESPIDAVERRHMLLMVARHIVQIVSVRPIRDGSANHPVFERDEVIDLTRLPVFVAVLASFGT